MKNRRQSDPVMIETEKAKTNVIFQNHLNPLAASVIPLRVFSNFAKISSIGTNLEAANFNSEVTK